MAGASKRAFINGQIITMDPNGSVVEAVLVIGEKIEAVGSTADITKMAGPDAQIVDLGGKTMLPGFIDPHSHFPMSGQQALFCVDLNSPPIGTVRSIGELKAALKANAAAKPKGEWIVGVGYDDSLLAEHRHPTRFDLDEASTEHPVLARHISGHVAVINTYALKKLNIGRDTPQPSGGEIGKDPVTGEPNGYLAEEAALHLYYSKELGMSFEQYMRAIEYAAGEYASRGLTTVQMGHLRGKPMLDALVAARRKGTLRSRLIVWTAPSLLDQLSSGRLAVEGLEEAQINLRTAKLFSDGSIQAYTGYLSKPYYKTPAGAAADYRGTPVASREKLAEQVAKAHCAGLQVSIHCNGDAAIDDALFAFERAQSQCPRSDARHVIVHCQMGREDQLDRIKALDLIPSFFTLHTYYWGDRHSDIFMGPERAARMSPARSAVDRGIRFTIHTDTPVVPMNPLLLVWAAVNRVSSSGRVIGAEQRISALEALRAITINAAWQAFQEDSLGSIEPGKYADLVVLSDNPLASPAAIKDMQVLETIVAGETVFKADGEQSIGRPASLRARASMMPDLPT